MITAEKFTTTKTVEKYRQHSRKARLGAAFAASAALLSACSSSSENEASQFAIEADRDNHGEDVGTIADEDHERGPASPYIPTEATDEEAAEMTKELEIMQARKENTIVFSNEQLTSGDYTYIVKGAEIHGKETLMDSISLSREDYPATTDESKRALAEDFIKVYQDVYINGGLTPEEEDRFGYGDPEDPESFLEENYYGDGIAREGLQAARTSTYEDAFFRAMTSPSFDATTNPVRHIDEDPQSIDERAREQYAIFQNTGELAEFEILGVDDVTSQIMDTEPGQLHLSIPMCDNMSEDNIPKYYNLVVEASKQDNGTLVATEFHETAVGGYVQPCD